VFLSKYDLDKVLSSFNKKNVFNFSRSDDNKNEINHLQPIEIKDFSTIGYKNKLIDLEVGVGLMQDNVLLNNSNRT
jgi:hypothetical protein